MSILILRSWYRTINFWPMSHQGSWVIVFLSVVSSVGSGDKQCGTEDVYGRRARESGLSRHPKAHGFCRVLQRCVARSHRDRPLPLLSLAGELLGRFLFPPQMCYHFWPSFVIMNLNFLRCSWISTWDHLLWLASPPSFSSSLWTDSSPRREANCRCCRTDAGRIKWNEIK